MGRQIDLDSPLSAENKQYLRDRGRGYLIPANERRFGADGTRTPEPHESVGATAQSPFYDNQEREQAVYDVGGAPLPGTVLNHDTGRVLDRENGLEVEYSGPGHTPGGYDLRIGYPEDDNYDPNVQYEAEGFTSKAVDTQGNPVDDEFDEDIVDYVKQLNVAELREELKQHEKAFASDDKKDALRDKLIIVYQDLRKSGVDVSFVDEDDDSEE